MIVLLAALTTGAGAATAGLRGAWLPPEGSLRGELTVVHNANDRWFCGEGRSHCATGDRAVFSDLTSRESSTTRSVYATIVATPMKHLSLFAEIPWHDVDYERFISSRPQPIDDLASTGVGDARLSARAGATWRGWALAAGYGISLPTGDFDVDAFLIPLGRGTLDHELSLEVGRSLHPIPAYLEAGILLRDRGTYTDPDGIVADWGNEFIWSVAGGYRVLEGTWLNLRAQGFTSGRFHTNISGEPEGDFRSSFDLSTGLYRDWGAFGAEIWGKVPLSGRNTPADATLGITLSARLVSWNSPGRGAQGHINDPSP